MAMSMSEIQDAVRRAAEGLFSNAGMIDVRDLFDGYAILCVEPKSTAEQEYPDVEYYRVDYTVNEADGTASLGDPTRVKKQTDWVSFADRRMPVIQQFADLGSYEFRTGDGTFAVLNVPVFKLGYHQGFPYDEQWAQAALENFAALKGEGFRPSVLKGHSKDNAELPAEGFLDNLRVEDEVIFGDLVDLNAGVFEEIQQGKWPYRSIEVFDRAARISAVALLGSSMPYHKFPALTPYSDGGAVAFAWTSEDSSHRGDEKGITMKTSDGLTRGGTPLNPPVNGGTGAVRTFTEDEVNAQLGAEKQRFEDARKADLSRIERLEREALDVRAARFAEKWGARLSPAVVKSAEFGAVVSHFNATDGPVRFAEGDEVAGLDALDRVLTLFADQASKSALLRPEPGVQSVDGVAEHPDDTKGIRDFDAPVSADEKRSFGDNPDPGALKMHRMAARFVSATKCTYRDALSGIRSGTIDEAAVVEAEKARTE